MAAPLAVDPAAGPRRLRAEVEQVGPLGEHGEAAVHGPRRVAPEAAVAERIRGEVEDAQDPRPLSQHQGAATGQPQGPGPGGLG